MRYVIYFLDYMDICIVNISNVFFKLLYGMFLLRYVYGQYSEESVLIYVDYFFIYCSIFDYFV